MPRVSYDYEPDPDAVPVETRTDLALSIKCPTCKAKPGDPCRYAKVKKPNWRTGQDKAWRRYELNGLPISRPHNERFTHASGALWKRRQQAERSLRLAYRTTRPDGINTIQAIREFDRQEGQQLAAWLRDHGHLFQEITPKESGT